MSTKIRFAALFAVVVVTGPLACSNPSRDACVPGTSIACVGVGNCDGWQVCRGDGAGYDACFCSSADDGGADDAGPDAAIDPAGDAGTDAGNLTDAGPDAAIDAGPDAGPDAAVTDICGTGLSSGNATCDTCLGNLCCGEITTCVADTACTECLSTGGSAPGCSSNGIYLATTSCDGSNCSASCP
jgi:hypothetical protein